MTESVFKRARCGELMMAGETKVGQRVECAACGNVMAIANGKASPAPNSMVPSSSPKGTRPASGIVRAGWICWALGMVLLCVLIVIPAYVPLFIASFVLGILAIARKRTGAGVALIVVSVLVPPLVAGVLAAAVIGAVMKGMPTPHIARNTPLSAPVARMTPVRDLPQPAFRPVPEVSPVRTSTTQAVERGIGRH